MPYEDEEEDKSVDDEIKENMNGQELGPDTEGLSDVMTEEESLEDKEEDEEDEEEASEEEEV